MKMFNKIMVAGAILCSAAGMVSAATVTNTIYISGSTAYRTATVTGIEAAYGGAFKCHYRDSDSGVTSEKNAKLSIFSGTMTGVGNPADINVTIVKCNWSGAVGGVQFVDQNLTTVNGNGFLDNSTLPAVNSVTHSASPAQSPIGALGANDGRVALSDCFQSSTPFQSQSLVDQLVAIIPFQWVVSGNAPAALTNMTFQNAIATWNYGFPNGTASAQIYTGNAADSGVLVYSTGRDPDSGTRTITFAESGIGINGAGNQYDIATGNLYPTQVINGITYTTGKGGESSGGNLATKMKSSGANGTKVYATYLGIGDAIAATTGSPGTGGVLARALSYNGVPFSIANVENGKYTFWSYEHLLYSQTLGGNAKTAADTIAAQIQLEVTDPAGKTINLNDMTVGRAGDGSPVVF